ncbi:MAG: NAD(P)H-binding protein [Chloroflexota bacterium]|nr:NAD(P)H-binding protein [Chloroflexota bacterium]
MGSGLDAVTGAFSFTGRAIAARLLDDGRQVVTLVRRSPAMNPFGGRIRVAETSLDDPAALTSALNGVDTLYNTHWIRFERGDVTFELAIARTLRLIEAARQAGVRRLVHISVVNASESAPTDYFIAKARLEDRVRQSGLSHAIVRPTLTYGDGDILVNNLCWVLRRFPAFGVPGDGRYRFQPVHVDDVAAIAVRAGNQSADLETDAAGPDIMTFDEFVRLLAKAIGRRVWLVHMPPMLSLGASRMLSPLVRDVLLTAHEVTELTASLLVSADPPAGTIRLADWAVAHAGQLGRSYHSELDRHFR